MTTNINKEIYNKVSKLPIAYFSENKNSRLLRKELIKNIIKQPICNINKLAEVFFSDENIIQLNKQLILKVYKISNKKYLIKKQNKKNLIVIMRYVWIQYSRSLDVNILEQNRDLNCKVITEILPEVMTNIEQYFGYIRDITQKREINTLPVNTSFSSRSTELPSTSEIFQNSYKSPL